MSIEEREPTIIGMDLSNEGDFSVISAREFTGRRFITPRRLVIECLKESDGELQCRYLTFNPDGGAIDFTVAAARKLLIPVH